MRRRRREWPTASAPSGAAISMPFDAEPRLKRRFTSPLTGHGRSPRKRPQRQRGGFGRRDSWRGHAAGHVAQHRLQLLLRGLQLARELRVQVALLIDVAHEVEARLRGALGRAPAPLRRRFAAPRGRRARSSSAGACSSARRASADATRRGRDRAWPARPRSASPGRDAADRGSKGAAADIAPGRACRSRPAARAAPAGLRAPGLQRLHPLGGRRQLGLDLRGVGGQPLQLFRTELALDLQLPQLAEQRAFLRGEPIGFALEGLQPLGRAPARAPRSRRRSGCWAT